MSYSQALEQQRRYARHFSSPDAVRDFYDTFQPDRSRLFHRSLMTTLAMADPYYWGREMCALLGSISETMPVWTLRLEALPTDFGFAWFTQPLVVPGVEWRVTAMTWSVWRPSGRDPTAKQNVIIGLFTEAATKSGQAGIVPILMFAWRPGATMGGDDLKVGPTTAKMDRANRRIFQYAAASFALMEQRILVTSREHPDRSARRRLSKEALGRISDILVVRLRRASQDHHDPSEAVEWSCRWVVRGHWRQQYYPSANEYRPIFILPHIKGPEDKPLRAHADRVFAVVR